MTAGDDPAPVTLLTGPDEFPRSGPIIADSLAVFPGSPGHAHPRFSAGSMTGEVSFTAMHLRGLTSRIDHHAAGYQPPAW